MRGTEQWTYNIIYFRQYSRLLIDLISVLLNAQSDRRPSAEQVLCIPALKSYMDGYIHHLQTTLPGSPRPTDDSAFEKENVSR